MISKYNKTDDKHTSGFCSRMGFKAVRARVERSGTPAVHNDLK